MKILRDPETRKEHNWNAELTLQETNTEINTQSKKTKGTDTLLRIRNIILRTIYLFSELQSPLPPYHASLIRSCTVFEMDLISVSSKFILHT